MEFKVGMRFKVGANTGEKGDIIEIIELFKTGNYEKARYRTIESKNTYISPNKVFTVDSVFAASLIPVPEPVKANECIVIYRKGDETIALDKRTGKKAVAKCSPEDEYDFTTGAKLAFERLTGTEESKSEEKTESYYSGKVVAISKVEGFTIGKIYEFVKGFTKDDDGIERPMSSPVKDSQSWYITEYFLPLVE